MWCKKSPASFVLAAVCAVTVWGRGYAQDSRETDKPGSLGAADLYAPSGNPVPPDGGARPGPGMEIVPAGGLQILVPKGMQVRKEGSQIVYEDIGEYLGRRLQVLEDRTRSLEEKQRDLELRIIGIEADVRSVQPLSSEHKPSTSTVSPGG